jgi:hypothetical protein
MEPTTDELLAMFAALQARRAASTNGDAGPWESPTPLVNWVDAYGNGDDPARWLAEPLLPQHGGVAIFAKGGTGKSLLALWLAAALSTGASLLGPTEPVEVLYLDYEMTIRDVVERLEDMGYDDPLRLDRLHYASLPSLPSLDTLEGGRAVLDMATHLSTALVVIDTFGRAVNGEEDRSDTVRAWYRWTGQLLKDAGIAFLRIDHAGKDVTRGQRGTSAKNDDVDVVWEMSEKDGGEYLLRATKRRMSWVTERVVLQRSDDDGVLTYHWTDHTTAFLAGTKEVAGLLDDLGAAFDISRRQAMILLRDAGHGRANNVVADALRYRHETVSTTGEYHFSGGSYPQAGTTPMDEPSPQVVPPEYHEYQRPTPNSQGGEVYEVHPLAGGDPGLFDPPPEEEF